VNSNTEHTADNVNEIETCQPIAEQGKASALIEYRDEIADGCMTKYAYGCSRERKPGRLLYRFFKRVFDIVFSLIVLIVGFVPSIVLCLFIFKDTHAAPIYTQKRVGMHGKHFTIYKFRTMVADSDEIEKHLSKEQLNQWFSEHKVDNDPRITPLGHILRRTSIDEIPNFINVLKGDMSIVGPRAITEEELHWFGNSLDDLLSVPAGITGWWQVSKRNEATFESGERQSLELYYVYNAGLILDLRIICATFGTMFGRKATGR